MKTLTSIREEGQICPIFKKFENPKSYRVCHGFRLMKRDNYFWSILTVFELSIIFGGSYGNIENWLDPKIEPPL